MSNTTVSDVVSTAASMPAEFDGKFLVNHDRGWAFPLRWASYKLNPIPYLTDAKLKETYASRWNIQNIGEFQGENITVEDTAPNRFYVSDEISFIERFPEEARFYLVNGEKLSSFKTFEEAQDMMLADAYYTTTQVVDEMPDIEEIREKVFLTDGYQRITGEGRYYANEEVLRVYAKNAYFEDPYEYSTKDWHIFSSIEAEEERLQVEKKRGTKCENSFCSE